MKKYNLIFRLSFITYIIVLIALPYITVRLWADMCMLLFILALIYQLVYLFVFRKKDNKNFSEVLGVFFIFTITSVSGYIFIDYLNVFINGYTPSDFVGNKLGHTYYGFEAILENEWSNIIYIPHLILNLLILIIYKLKKKKNQNLEK